jgi:hypothetical protein
MTLLTTSEIALALGITERAVRDLYYRGVLPRRGSRREQCSDLESVRRVSATWSGTLDTSAQRVR